MSCQTCCKIFCSRRDQEENCSEKITYVEAGILEKVKVNKIRMDIEEDIKILQKFTELDRKLRNYKVESDYDNFCERRCVAITHILAEREENKKKIAELEAKLEFYQWGDLDNLKFEEYMKEFIPKQKVKEGLEDIEDYFDRLNGPDEDMKYIRNKKKELLEEK